MPIVSNTSPLIWLSKIGRITLLKKLFGDVVVPDEVYREAVERGLQEGFSDALAIKECVEQGWIKISKLDEREIKLSQRMTEHAGGEGGVGGGVDSAVVYASLRGVFILGERLSLWGRVFSSFL